MSACIPADRLIQTLLTQVPGVTRDMLNLQLFNVVDEFLRRTNAWKEEADIDFEIGETQYGLSVPAGSTLVRVMGISRNGQPMTAAGSGITQQSIGRLTPEEIFPDGDTSYAPTEIGGPVAGDFDYAIYEPDYITTSTVPDAEMAKYPMKVTMALSLGSRCLECDCGDWNIPEWMWDMYFQAWLDGTLERLYIMPAKPWSNEKQAIIHGKRFRNAKAFHRQEAARGYVYNTPNWRFPQRGGWVR